MNFQDCEAILDGLRIEYSKAYEYRGEPGKGRKEVLLDQFHSVLLPLSPEEWLSVAMNDGINYVGGCCGAMSVLQDIVNEIFRFQSGWAKCEQLESMAELIVNHGDFEGTIPWDKPPKPIDVFAKEVMYDKLEVWSKIALCWHLVKDNYCPKIPHATNPKNSKLYSSVYTLSTCFQSISWMHFFDKDVDEDVKTQRNVRNILTLHRVLPALKDFNEHLDELDCGEFTGFALFDKDNNNVCENYSGYCIYETKEQCDKLIGLWVKSAEQYQEDKRLQHLHDHIIIRPVRVSKENGIEFLDEAKQ